MMSCLLSKMSFYGFQSENWNYVLLHNTGSHCCPPSVNFIWILVYSETTVGIFGEGKNLTFKHLEINNTY